MRTVTKEQISSMKVCGNFISFKLNTPKPIFTDLNLLSKQFEAPMKKNSRRELTENIKVCTGKNYRI